MSLGKSRRLNNKMRADIRKLAQEHFNSPANKETDGMLLVVWIISLLENIHLYPEWFEEKS